VWIPGADFGGRGSGVTPLGFASQAILRVWDEEIGFDRGLHHVFLKHYRYNHAGASLEEFANYISLIVQRGGMPLVRLVGTPEALSNDTNVSWWWSLQPNNLTLWQEMIYDELRYIVVPDVEVNNSILFNDDDVHTSLGLGDNMLFSLWYGVWGPYDPFQYHSSQEEFFSLWNATYQASKRVEDDYGVDIKLGGFGFGQVNDSLWGVGGLIFDLFNFSRDPNRDGDESDRIPIDWVDYQFRHPSPFAISHPDAGSRDERGQIRQYLERFGYNPDEVLVMANEWHSQHRVYGLNTSIGREITRHIETQSEIDAALVPSRLFDMEVAGQEKQVRESIQDYAEDDFPLFQREAGGIGIFTLGFGSDDDVGLKKANYNAFRLVDMLGDVKLRRYSSHAQFLTYGDRIDATVNVYGTRSNEDDSIRILAWSYFSPYRYVGYTPPNNQVDYYELYDEIMNDIGGEFINVSLTVTELNFENDINVVRYLIDRNHSNSFTYRNEICNAIRKDIENKNCVETFSYDLDYALAEVNNWTMGNNPYNVSVALEMVENYTVPNADVFVKEMVFEPYTVSLIILREGDPTELNPDMNGDGLVNIFDLIVVVQSFGLHDGDEGFDVYADFDQDGQVGISDLIILANNFT
jgi:hypothetical protein